MAHVIRTIERPPVELVEAFRRLSAATVYEALGRRGALDARIKAVSPGVKLCGPAITVLPHVGDVLMLHKAVALAQAGDVIVCEPSAQSETALLGELLTLQASVRGIAGFVINGYVRDVAAIRWIGLPVFALGASVRGAVRDTLGFINHTISCAGVPVSPGDIVLGDDDGVVVVPRLEAQAVLARALEREARELALRDQIRHGRTTMELLGLDAVAEAQGLEEV